MVDPVVVPLGVPVAVPVVVPLVFLLAVPLALMAYSWLLQLILGSYCLFLVHVAHSLLL